MKKVKSILKYISESGAMYIFSVLVCAAGAYLMHRGGTSDMDVSMALGYLVLGGALVSYALVALCIQIGLHIYFDFVHKDEDE